MRTVRFEMSFEDIKSRVFGLFPCIARNSEGALGLHLATEYKNGCYNHIIPNLRLPLGAGLDGVLESGSVYSYATLIRYYYECKKKNAVSGFVDFMRRGIGEMDFPITGTLSSGETYDFSDRKVYDLVPEKIYLSQIRARYADMVKLKMMCDNYSVMIQNGSDEDVDICCKCRNFERMGGEKFMKAIKDYIPLADSVAQEYLGYAVVDMDENVMATFDFSLFSSAVDEGVMEPYINQFEPGKQYYDGDIFTYNGRTYVCSLLELGSNPNITAFPCVYARGNYYAYNPENESYEPLIGVEEFISFLHIPSDYSGYYVCGGNLYNTGQSGEVEVTRYVTGVWNEESYTLDFDNVHFIPLSKYQDTEFYSNETPSGDKWKLFSDTDTNPIGDGRYGYDCGVLRYDGLYYVWDSVIGGYKLSDSPELTDNDMGSFTVSGITNSVLTGLRSPSTFIGSEGFVEEPNEGEDWLYYYKIGHISNFITLNDDNGNIAHIHDGSSYPNVGEMDYDLEAYGTVINNIYYDDDEKTVTFVYTVNAHLAGVVTGKEIIDGNEEVTFGSFEYDSNSHSGIVHTETYACPADGEIVELAEENDDFEYYVRHYDDVILKYGDLYLRIGENLVSVTSTSAFGTNRLRDQFGREYDYAVIQGDDEYVFYEYNGNGYSEISQSEGGVEIRNYRFYSFPFRTDANTDVNVMEVCNEYVSFPSIVSEFTSVVDCDLDIMHSPNFRRDYFNGFTFSPKIESEVNIGRGNAAAWERHVKLGEVKTLEAFENYSNGGFFNVTKA